MNKRLAWTFLAATAAASWTPAGLAGAPGGHAGGFTSSPGMMGASTMHGAGAGSFDAGGQGARGQDAASSHGAAYQASPESLLGQNSALDSRLQKLLPAGTTPQQACAGFSHLGDCVAAMHVAHNLAIPFDELKSRLTGASSVNLGTAIHDLKPQANAGSAERQAGQQAQNDLSGTGH